MFQWLIQKVWRKTPSTTTQPTNQTSPLPPLNEFIEEVEKPKTKSKKIPLPNGKSKKAVSENISELVRSGKPKKQPVANTLNKSRDTKKNSRKK